MMNAEARTNTNAAARALLASAVAVDANVRPLGHVRLGVQAVVETFESEPEASAAALRQLLTDEEVQTSGWHNLRLLAEAVPTLIVDPALVADIYRAAFGWRDTSDESTPLRAGVLALSSNRRQDYDGARRELAEHFPLLLQAAPAESVRVLATAVRAYVEGRALTFGDTQDLHLGGGALHVVSDGSAYWDRQGRPEESEVEMLDAFEVGVTKGDEAFARCVVDALATETTVPAAIVSRLLAAVPAASELLTPFVRDALPCAVVLAHSDLLVAYGDALRGAWPLLTEPEKETVENALMALPDEFQPNAPDIGESRRDRLIGLLDPGSVISGPAQQLRGQLAEAGAEETNEPLVNWGGVEFRAVGDDEALRMRGVDPDLDGNRRLLELTRAVRDWHMAKQQADRATPPLDDLVAALTNLGRVLPELAQSDEVADELLNDAAGHLAQGGFDLAETITPQSPSEQLELALEIARSAATHALPVAADEDPAKWDGDMPGWGWPAPRVEAACIWLVLGRFPEFATQEVLAGISAAATDPAAAVRMKVAQYGWWIASSDVESAWSNAERSAREEERAAVLHALLITLSHLYPDDRDRAVGLVEQIREREETGRRSGHLLAAIAGLLAEWWIYEERQEGRLLLDRLLQDLREQLDVAMEVVGRLRRAVVYTADDADAAARVRTRAFALYGEFVEAACDLFDERVAEANEDDGAETERLRHIAQLLDRLAAELYFSSGAYDRGEGNSSRESNPPPPARFYQEGAAVLDLAVRIGIPRSADYLLRTLSYFVDVDPQGVIRRIAELLTNGEQWGLAADSLTESHFMPTVSHLLSAHRDLLLADGATRAHLVTALSVFSRAGFPSARRILYGLDDMFR